MFVPAIESVTIATMPDARLSAVLTFASSVGWTQADLEALVDRIQENLDNNGYEDAQLAARHTDLTVHVEVDDLWPGDPLLTIKLLADRLQKALRAEGQGGVAIVQAEGAAGSQAELVAGAAEDPQ